MNIIAVNGKFKLESQEWASLTMTKRVSILITLIT
jgi:hypothetical protein